MIVLRAASAVATVFVVICVSIASAQEGAVKGYTHHANLSAAAEPTVAVEFFPGVKIGSEPAVTNAAGKVVSSKLLLNQEYGKLLMVFDATGGGTFTLHYGGANGFASRPAKKYEPTPSLLMEVRTMNGGSLTGLAGMKRAIEDSKIQGMMFVPNIYHGFNLFGRNEEFWTVYRGELTFAQDIDYRIFTASSDASFVVVDGQPLCSWPGLHSAEGGVTGTYGRQVKLTKGKHKIEYYHGYLGKGTHAKAAPQACMALGWQKESSKKTDPFIAVPPTAFVHTPSATVAPPVKNDAPATAHFVFSQDALLIYDQPSGFTGNYQYVRYNFSNHSTGKVDSVLWDFGDGVTSAEPRAVSHVFVDDAPYRVKLTMKSGDKSDTCEVDVPFITPMSNATINEDSTVKEFCKAVRAYPFDKLPVKVLSRVFELVDVLERPLLLEPIAEVLYKKYPTGPLAVRAKRILAKSYSITDPKKALPLLQSFAESNDPSAIEFKVDLIELYLHKFRDFAKVKEVAESYVLANAPDSTMGMIAKVKQGDIFLLQGDLQKAEEKYRQAQAAAFKEIDSREIDVRQGGHSETVGALITSGKLRAAREALIEWEAQFPVSKITGDFILVSSRYWEAIGDYRRALDDMECLIKINPLTPYLPQIEYRMGNAYRFTGEPEKAKALYLKVIKEYPKNDVCSDARTALSALGVVVEPPPNPKQPQDKAPAGKTAPKPNR